MASSNNETIKNSATKRRKLIITATKLLFILFILSNVSFYFHERSKWINSQHAHLKAKEYYVLNRMVFFYRKILTNVVRVDNPLMYPFNKLQEALYNKGISYLPQDDAEESVWKYNFFLYFYGKGFYLPDDGTPKNIDSVSQAKVMMLDEIYNVIVNLATKPIADKEINEIRYKIFPLIAMLYQSNQFDYFGNDASPVVRDRLLRDKEKFTRMINIVDWLEKNKLAWNFYPTVLNDITNKEQQVEMFHYVSVLNLLEYILLKKIHYHELGCNDTYAINFIDNRNALIKFCERNDLRISPKQIRLVKNIALSSGNSAVIYYLLADKCRLVSINTFSEAEQTKNWQKEGYTELEREMDLSIQRNK